jgi:glycosyltransferase involved in cell wall biosynthesis
LDQVSLPLQLSPATRVGIVVPVYNEAEAVQLFHAELCAVIDALPQRFAIYYVNDGSTDATNARLAEIALADERVNVLELSRNFGHQAAITAGLDAAAGDYVICMDGDGQHPPELIPEMLHLAANGYEVVLTQRAEEPSLSPFKRWTSGLFYRLINQVGETNVLPGGADFRLLARNALDALRSMPEYHRFLRGMVSWIGFHTIILPYQPAERLAGRSKYTLRKMLSLASNAIFSFSLVPLYVGLTMGLITLLLAVVEMIYVLSFWISGRQAGLEPGWSSLMFVILVTSGILMILLGFVGVYIGYIFQEVKGRPVYILRTPSGPAAPPSQPVVPARPGKAPKDE